MKPTSIKFPPDLREKAQRVADECGISFGDLVRVALTKELRALETKQPKRARAA